MMSIVCTREELPSLIRDLTEQGLAFEARQTGCDRWVIEITGY
jgi:hypothetical protein